MYIPLCVCLGVCACIHRHVFGLNVYMSKNIHTDDVPAVFFYIPFFICINI